MTVAWIADFPGAGWQFSNNAGGSWAAYPVSTNIGQVVGPTGTQRFRPPTPFVVPVGVASTHLRVRWRGDIHDGLANVPPELRIDGALVATAPLPLGIATTYDSLIPMPAPGPHTFEVWVGQAPNAGQTFLTSVAFDLVSPVPCSCCPLADNPTRCWNDGVGGSGTAVGMLCCVPVVGATYEVDWQYAHRNRTAGPETATLRIGDATNPLGTNPIVDTHVAAGPAVWTVRSGTLPIGAGFSQLRFEFVPTGGTPGIGNFLDSCSIILRRVLPTPANFGEQLFNPGFEIPVVPGPITFPVAAPSTGWQTTEACNCLEYWRAASGVPPHSGNQFAEMNVFGFGTLSQVVTLETCENQITWFDVATGNVVPTQILVPCP